VRERQYLLALHKGSSNSLESILIINYAVMSSCSGENTNKKVVAPNRWFGANNNTDDSDIVPDNWRRV
jgi:hypothetical protein